ncbi:galactokinase [Jeotgalibacillus aurantiacus]|uniref:galactokinase n=1 Tax=Jeotgalibacillus aurantiacus TaxID=2763266 RepID=UPI001D0BAD5B|nr:galactokinase [Jeotgalibacillus aurantiacus]
MIRMKTITEAFISQFGGSSEEVRVFFAPGRVNLIGEHIDYNGGHVLPCALEIGTYLAVRKRSDSRLLFYSKNFQDKGVIEADLSTLVNDPAHSWANYPKGVISFLSDRIGSEGYEFYFCGNIPNGAGLSSSASIELVTAVCLNEMNGIGLSSIELVKLSQQVENQFIGVNCGIMDQFAVGFGEADQAVLLNCETLEYRYVPLNLPNHSIVIANTNKQRGLADSAYNERRAVCESALEKLKTEFPIQELCHLNEGQLVQAEQLLDPEEKQRVRHVVTENERTLKAVDVLEQDDLFAFGELMKASHLSLRDDYEVSCLELDAMVEAAWKQKGVVGARMTGAGFGGCTVNIVEDQHVESFKANVKEEYTAKTGLVPEFYTVKVGRGTRELTGEEVTQLQL